MNVGGHVRPPLTEPTPRRGTRYTLEDLDMSLIACRSCLFGSVIVILATPANTNIIGKEDGRRSISIAAPEFGLTDDEVTQARLMTGYMVCPGSDAGNGAAISGGIVGETNIAVTNAHLFFDPVGNPRLPFEDCHFRNHAEPPGIIPFDISGGFYLGAKRLIQADNPRDFAVAKLAFRVEGADPYPIFVPDRGANIVGEEIIVVTAYAPSLGADQLGPIIQRCTVQMMSRESETFKLITDCDLEPVGSGSLVLVRRGGILHALGLMSSSGKNHLDGVDFDLLSGSYSSGPGFYGDFESAIVALSHGTSVPANNSYLPE